MLLRRLVIHHWSLTPKAIVISRLISRRINRYKQPSSQRKRRNRPHKSHLNNLNLLRKLPRMTTLFRVRILMQRLSSFKSCDKSWIKTQLQPSWRDSCSQILRSKKRKSRRRMIKRQLMPPRICTMILGRVSQHRMPPRRRVQHSNRMTMTP